MNTELDYRADFYSLGITLYQMLIWAASFDAETLTELVFFLYCEDAAGSSRDFTNVPPMLQGRHRQTLSKMPKDRYLSCEGLFYDGHGVKGKESLFLAKRISAGA